MTDEEKPKQKNPDLLPATRGYVKCIARRINSHKHPQNSDPFVSAILTALGGLVWIFMVVDGAIAHTPHAPEWAYWLVTLFTVTQLSALYTTYSIDDGETGPTSYNSGDQKLLKAWEPKKSECCEPEEDGSYSRY
jgi:hypothetical protein